MIIETLEERLRRIPAEKAIMEKALEETLKGTSGKNLRGRSDKNH